VNTLLSMVAVAVAVLALFVLYGILAIVVRLTRDAGRLQRRAAQRCGACARRPQCAALLATRDWNALRTVCPVPGYIDRLRTG
jgi:hypothetical protein